MKPAVYLTDLEGMRKARLNQPSVSSAQARAQRERLRRATEQCSRDAKLAISSPGREKAVV